MEDDFNKLMKLDMSYPGISFGYNTWALGAYLDSLENFIDIAKEQYRIRAKHELEIRKDELEPEEYYHQKEIEIDEAADVQIPRYARMSAIVPLWGIFELTVIDITNYIAKNEKTKLNLTDIKSDNVIDKIKKYYYGVLSIDLPWSHEQLIEINQFYKIRNAVAHRNGRFQDDNEQRQKEIKNIVSDIKNVEIYGHQLEISKEYIVSSTKLVFSMLESLNQLVCNRYDALEALSNKT